ncbi:hypothetical protein EDD18DRAFT_440797 [Armillaria luteobubalina]|uniref:Uncharacterized protein n=1 Tax=Armillaria luteobubalina TaxID=153913 RepID=A0AA39PYF8_9AGAR|nr:hypothetical protein EDD18DRAFT_440797 [Armillaria luteobubalina]
MLLNPKRQGVRILGYALFHGLFQLVNATVIPPFPRFSVVLFFCHYLGDCNQASSRIVQVDDSTSRYERDVTVSMQLGHSSSVRPKQPWQSTSCSSVGNGQ